MGIIDDKTLIHHRTTQLSRLMHSPTTIRKSPEHGPIEDRRRWCVQCKNRESFDLSSTMFTCLSENRETFQNY